MQWNKSEERLKMPKRCQYSPHTTEQHYKRLDIKYSLRFKEIQNSPQSLTVFMSIWNLKESFPDAFMEALKCDIWVSAAE